MSTVGNEFQRAWSWGVNSLKLSLSLINRWCAILNNASLWLSSMALIENWLKSSVASSSASSSSHSVWTALIKFRASSAASWSLINFAMALVKRLSGSVRILRSMSGCEASFWSVDVSEELKSFNLSTLMTFSFPLAVLILAFVSLTSMIFAGPIHFGASLAFLPWKFISLIKTESPIFREWAFVFLSKLSFVICPVLWACWWANSRAFLKMFRRSDAKSSP